MTKHPKTNIILAGYGAFGSALLDWLKSHHQTSIHVICVIEPNRHKRDLLKKMNYSTYESIYDVLPKIINQSKVVVDCSPRGVGASNKPAYQQYDLPAIFQNGEEDENIGEIFYPGLTDSQLQIKYLKIPLCSGIAAIKVVKCIRKLANIKYITGYHYKVTNTARMITTNYQDSNNQINKLLGIESRMNVVYLRGEPHNGIFAYHGNLDIEVDRTVKKTDVLRVLSDQNELLKVENQDIDNISYQRTDLTVIIKESVHIRNRILRLSTLSFTPDVNFPIILTAIKFIANQKHI